MEKALVERTRFIFSSKLSEHTSDAGVDEDDEAERRRLLHASRVTNTMTMAKQR